MFGSGEMCLIILFPQVFILYFVLLFRYLLLIMSDIRNIHNFDEDEEEEEEN